MNRFFHTLTALTCLALAVTTTGCDAQKRKKDRRPDKVAKTAAPTEQKPVLVASIEMGPCFGKCPTYKAMIYRPGRMEYYGRRNMPKNDTLQYKLMDGFVANLIQEAKRIKFTALPDTLPMPTDVSRITLFMFIDGKKKSVYFTNVNAPDELREFSRHFHDNVVSILEEQEPIPKGSDE
jgi:hypothetical protein